MSDERRIPAPNSPVPSPLLQTRPATLLTAVGLCLLVMLMQFAPEVRASGARLTSVVAGSAR